MKKIWLLTGLLLAMVACRRTAHVVSADPWADYRKAYDLLNTHKDSAFLNFNRLADNSNDQHQVALAYYNMALIQSDAGDHYGAQESLTMSFKSLDEHQPEDRNYLATDYNELGMACFNLQEYTKALDYYQQALHYADDRSLVPYILNNRGNAYQKLRDYQRALASYKQVIGIADKKGTIYARALTNLATTKWLRDPRYNAAPELWQALVIRQHEKDAWGENSSYAHLSDFYTLTRPDSALWYARKMSVVARRLKSPDDELEAMQKLILLSKPMEVRPYFLRYQELSDSLGAARKAAKNQFALIRYDVEKNKADNLRLQKDNTEKKYQLGGVLAAMLLGTMITVFWYRKRKQRLQLEAENKIRQNRLRLSQKVHDVVANGIYRLMNEVEYGGKVDKVHLLDQLDLMYGQSRDITYEQEPALRSEFSESINILLNAFKSRSVKLAVMGNDSSLWKGVREEIKCEVEPVLQELMVNMTKHSRASQALVAFERKDGYLLVDYRDNGIGLPDGLRLGNGLRNTVSRIETLRGELKFDSLNIKGTQLKIIIPLA